MSTQPADHDRPDDTPHWAPPISRLPSLSASAPSGAINLNLEGRQVVGALQGFGQLWQKTFKVRLSGVKATPEEVMQTWKENFARFQPSTNHFYPSLVGFKPGEVIWIDSKLPILPGLPGIIPIASGVMVLYADDTTITVMTPEGFPVSGWNSFSTYEEDGAVVAQAESFDRPSDPIYEFGFRLMGGSPQQDAIWVHVLESLAEFYGVKGQVKTRQICLDSKLQWRYARNIWNNAAIRTFFYVLTTPFRWFGNLFKRSSK
jgi:hypothetical protein